MSSVNPPDSASKSAAKKKKRGNKKKGAEKSDGEAKGAAVNGTKEDVGGEEEEEDDQDDGVESAARDDTPNHVQKGEPLSSAQEPAGRTEELPVRNGAQRESRNDGSSRRQVNETDTAPTAIPPSDASSRLEAMQQERDSLRAEVTELRQNLESLQSKHFDEVSTVRQELETAQKGKEHSETQYRTLMTRVNQIKTQLGDRLKADAAELEQARGRIEELERSNDASKEENERLQGNVTQLNQRIDAQSGEIDGLRNRSTLSTSNWAQERDEMISREAYLREEYEVAKQAMQDWEQLATEERSRREGLEERAQDLEEQLAAQRDAYDRIRGEANTQSSTVDGLQRALRDLQDERKRELRETVEASQAQLDDLRAQARAATDSAATLEADLTTTRAELARASPFEKEVKEKNLLIGKLRHEAVILNDHLTRALKFLKRGKPEDNVDRQLVTNHLLHFLALERGDAKKFQVLQLIAALLGWSEEQREQAGLQRQGSGGWLPGGPGGAGGAGGSLRLPKSPFGRTPSTPTLSSGFEPLEGVGGAGGARDGGGREGLAELWSAFLEREAESGKAAGSRRGSAVIGPGPGGRRPSGLASPGARSDASGAGG